MKKLFLIPILACSFFCACSDDSSNSASADEPPLSSEAEVEIPIAGANSSDSQVPPEVQEPSNSDISDITPPSSEPIDCVNPQPVEFPLNEFIDIGEVYQNIQCNEKVIFIIRHAERDLNFSEVETPITEDGVLESIDVGARLKGDIPFHFVHSGFVRTYQTTYYIALGRGQVSSEAEFSADTLTELAEGWYVKNKELRDEYNVRDSLNNILMLYSMWAYDGTYPDVFYDMEERSLELLDNYIVKDYSELSKYTLMSSHDVVLMPLTVWATNKEIDLNLHDPEPPRPRLNYLAGVAVIINDKNERRYVAIKGLDKGTR